MGGGRTAEACEALHRKHASYLAIPKEFQSVQAFTAMVENAQKEAAAEQAVSGEEGAGSGSGAGSRSKLGDVEEEEEGEEGEDAQASGREGSDVGDEDGYGDHEEPGLAAGRSRRTPKRSGLRTPLSAAKRGRGDENIYEYYGEGADVTESARKRRARGAPDFPASQRRRHDTGQQHPGLPGTRFCLLHACCFHLSVHARCQHCALPRACCGAPLLCNLLAADRTCITACCGAPDSQVACRAAGLTCR